LNSLPSGWSSSVQSFACANVSTGNGCQLSLTYAPSADASSTLALHYSYTDNAATAKTGTVNIPYVATAHDKHRRDGLPHGTNQPTREWQPSG